MPRPSRNANSPVGSEILDNVEKVEKGTSNQSVKLNGQSESNEQGMYSS